jgi:hypothetical protein
MDDHQEMDKSAESIIQRALVNYRRGMFCPAEFWNIVSDAIAESGDAEAVQKLPDSLRSQVVAAFNGYPVSLNSDAEPCDVRKQLFDWFQEGT